MGTSIFQLDTTNKTLKTLERRFLADLGLTEPYDLEAWLASAKGELFGRRVLWIARQDRPTGDERSDLLGVDQDGDLLVTELKRGTLGEDAVTQALGYAAEYSGLTPDQLAEMYLAHSAKHANAALLSKASSIEDATRRLSSHVGTEIEVNEAQILLLVAEDFSPKALAICDYLSNASGDATYSLECWQYSVFKTADDQHYFALEQILPAPNVRETIDEKREATKARKYARDPVRIEFMNGLLAYLSGKGIHASRHRGASYSCSFSRPGWPDDAKLTFSVHFAHPILTLGSTLHFNGDPAAQQVRWADHWYYEETIEFGDIDSSREKFSPLFGDRLIAVLEKIAPKTAGDVASQAAR
jgi:hypothetical protein